MPIVPVTPFVPLSGKRLRMTDPCEPAAATACRYGNSVPKSRRSVAWQVYSHSSTNTTSGRSRRITGTSEPVPRPNSTFEVSTRSSAIAGPLGSPLFPYGSMNHASRPSSATPHTSPSRQRVKRERNSPTPVGASNQGKNARSWGTGVMASVSAVRHPTTTLTPVNSSPAHHRQKRRARWRSGTKSAAVHSVVAVPKGLPSAGGRRCPNHPTCSGIIHGFQGYPTCARNFPSISLNSFGRSRFGRWAAPSITRSVESGSAACIASASETGV